MLDFPIYNGDNPNPYTATKVLNEFLQRFFMRFQLILKTDIDVFLHFLQIWYHL